MLLPRKSPRKTSLMVLAIFLAPIAAGILYEKISEHRDRTRYVRIGEPVDVGGRTLNLYCSGQGSPTVVFESGSHTAGYGWVKVQREVARFTRACWYDRAGYGWSDPGPAPRTFGDIAEDLHHLLHTAGVPGPYMLVGATAGAYHVRVYTGRYPGEVAGAVLIAAFDTDIAEHEPPFMRGKLAGQPRWIQQIACRVVRPAMAHAGVMRLIRPQGGRHPFAIQFLAPEEQRELITLSRNPLADLSEGEACSLDESLAEVRAAGNFGDRPLRVLISDVAFDSPDPQFAESMKQLNRFWFGELQPRLAALSSRGQLYVNEDAENPEVIVAAVKAVVIEARQRPPGGTAAVQAAGR